MLQSLGDVLNPLPAVDRTGQEEILGPSQLGIGNALGRDLDQSGPRSRAATESPLTPVLATAKTANTDGPSAPAHQVGLDSRDEIGLTRERHGQSRARSLAEYQAQQLERRGVGVVVSRRAEEETGAAQCARLGHVISFRDPAAPVPGAQVNFGLSGPPGMSP